MIPSVIYLFTMINTICFILQEDIHKWAYFNAVHRPLIGALVVFMVNQLLIEYHQLQKQPSIWSYYSDMYNINDSLYLVMNMATLIINTIY